MRRHGNMAFAVVFFVIGILMFVFTKDFAYNGLMNFGAGFWPRVIAVIMMVCAVLLFITSLLSKDPKMNEVVIDWKSAGMKRVYKVCGMMILFCVLLYLFGLCIALAFMIRYHAGDAREKMVDACHLFSGNAHIYLCGVPAAPACQTADGHYLQLRRFEKCLMLLPFPSLLVSF